MNIMAAFGNYLGAEHLGTTTPTVTIADVRKEDVADDKGVLKSKAVVHFKDTPRGWILNRTNALSIAAMFGVETTAWTGKRLTLYAAEVQLGKERTMGVRVKGSPDIEKDVTFELRLPRKKAQSVRLQKTGGKAQAPASEPAPDPAPEPDSITDPETGERF